MTHHRAKLTMEDADLIRELYGEPIKLVVKTKSPFGVTHKQLAEKFEVHPRTIDRVIKCQTWNY